MQHFPHGIGLKFLGSEIPSTCGVNMTNLTNLSQCVCAKYASMQFLHIPLVVFLILKGEGELYNSPHEDGALVLDQKKSIPASL